MTSGEVLGARRVSELRAAGVGVRFGSATVLADVDLVAPAGRWVTITGPSGSGKSVLLQILAGLIAPTSGDVLVDGRPAWTGPDERVLAGVVLQEYALLPLLTATETVALPLQARRVSKDEIDQRVRRSLEATGLTSTADQLVTNLSGGQRQRVAIARALALQSPVLLLDEPTAELDAANRGHVLDLLRAAADDGAVLVVVSHDPAILDCSDTVVTLTAQHTLD